MTVSLIHETFFPSIFSKMSRGTAVRRYDAQNDTKPTLWILEKRVCPFAQKALIALYEMGVDFDIIEVDAKNKPASLFEVNKKGLVPALKDQGNAVVDSYIVLEYINDMWKKSDGKGLFPESPSQRAVARTWSTFISNNLVKNWSTLLFSKDEKVIEEAKQKLADDIKVLEDAMKSISEGPFFMGEELGVVDIMLAPHIERIPVLENLKGFKMPDAAELPRFQTWWNAVEAWPSYQQSKGQLDTFIASYKKLLEK